MPRKIKSFEERRDQFVKAKLRRASMYWPEKNEAKKAARIERGLYQCAMCKKAFRHDEVELDHKECVIEIGDNGVLSWDKYIERLFVTSNGYQVLCKRDHETKTLLENNMRSELTKAKKSRKIKK